MNFYEFYRLLNEYGQTLIQTLIKKFQEEEPTLTPTIIRNYIERFENIKNNLPEKDITKYSWKDLENAVDSYQTKEKIKAGKLDPTVSDANLLYNKDGIRIYLGKDKKSCIKYGNGYSFCISARGENNMYSHYRIKKQGTPYFIFNDNLPKNKENPNHVLVLFVYKNIPPDRASYMTSTKKARYTITNALNKGEKPYESIKNIVRDYPWTSPITNFVDDENKGTVDIDPLEMIENRLSDELSSMKEEGFYLDFDAFSNFETDYETEHSLNELFTNCSTQEYKDFLNNKLNIAIVHVYSPGLAVSGGRIYGWFGNHADDFVMFYKTESDILKELKERSIYYVGEDFKIHGSYENILLLIKNALNNSDNELARPEKMHNIKLGENGVFGVFGTGSYRRDSYIVKLSSPRKLILEILDKNKLQINRLNEYKLKYNKAVNWIKNQSEEKLKEIEEAYNKSLSVSLEGRPPMLFVDFIISFMN